MWKRLAKRCKQLLLTQPADALKRMLKTFEPNGGLYSIRVHAMAVVL